MPLDTDSQIPRAQMLTMSATILSAFAAAAIAPMPVFAATPAMGSAADHITVLATLTAKPDMGQQLHDLFLGLVGPARGDAGNISYELVQGIDDPLVFVSIERWASAESLQAHLKTKPITDAVAKLGPILAAPPAIVSYRMISPPA